MGKDDPKQIFTNESPKVQKTYAVFIQSLLDKKE